MKRRPKVKARRKTAKKRPWADLDSWLAAQRVRADRNLATILSEERSDGRATPEEGCRVLLDAEGGCVSVNEACRLFRKPRPVTRRTLTAAIRKGAVIGYRTGGDHYAVPVWQFRREGGVIKDLPEVLGALRSRVPGYGQLSPFTFLLQADIVTDGRKPLSALRNGEIGKVLDAVAGHIH